MAVVAGDSDYSPANGLFNQAVASGTDPEGNNTMDASDDTTPNGNDTGGTNDATPLIIPQVGVSKAVVNVIPAPEQGHSLVTFEITLQNTGTVKLQNLTLTDDIDGQLNNAYVSITSAPAITSSSAAMDPTSLGTFPDAIFNGMSGMLLPGEYITVQFTVDE